MYTLPNGVTLKDPDWYLLTLEQRKQAEGKYIEEHDSRYSYRPYIPLDEFLQNSKYLFLYAIDIKPEERIADIPEQGYIWVD